MVHMVECPMNGCERALTDENGAVMHIINTNDEAHEHVGSKPEALDELGGWPPTDDTDDDADDDTDELDDDRGDDAVRDPVIPEADDDTDDEPDVVDCPECAADLGERDAVATAIDEHGRVFCEHCGARVVRE